MNMSSCLTCNMVPPRAPRRVAHERYEYDGPPQPRTATCCTALQLGFSPDGGLTSHPRFAPMRTAPMQHDDDDGDADDEGGRHRTPKAKAKAKQAVKKTVRKCKSSLADVHALMDADQTTPRLRRSGAVRRDWSFEDLRTAHNHKAP